jgi:hypothetical protein
MLPEWFGDGTSTRSLVRAIARLSGNKSQRINSGARRSLAALILSQPSFAGDKKKLTDAECQVKRTKLAELQEADLATLKIDEATRQKMVDKEQSGMGTSLISAVTIVR